MLGAILGAVVIGVFAVPLVVCAVVLVFALRRAFNEGPGPERSVLDHLLERNETPGRWGWALAGWAFAGTVIFGVGLFVFALPIVLG